MHTRYIKPDFFKDEDLADLEAVTRIVYAGLWCMADREGRLDDRPERIKAEILPYDKTDIVTQLDILAKPKRNSKIPFIIRYQVNNQKYIQILKWGSHQSPHKSEADSKIPPITSDTKIDPTVYNTYIYVESRKCPDRYPIDNRQLTVNDQKDGLNALKPIILKGLELYEADSRLCSKIQKALPAWVLAYPGVNVPDAIKRAHAWEVSNPKRRKIDRVKFLQSWLAREQDKYRPPESGIGGHRNPKISPHHPKAAPGKYANFGKPKEETKQEESDDGEFSKEDSVKVV